MSEAFYGYYRTQVLRRSCLPVVGVNSENHNLNPAHKKRARWNKFDPPALRPSHVIYDPSRDFRNGTLCHALRFLQNLVALGTGRRREGDSPNKRGSLNRKSLHFTIKLYGLRTLPFVLLLQKWWTTKERRYVFGGVCVRVTDLSSTSPGLRLLLQRTIASKNDPLYRYYNRGRHMPRDCKCTLN